MMKIVSNKIFYMVYIPALILMLSGLLYPVDYDFHGTVRAKRKDKLLTAVFTARPEVKTYFIISGENAVGTFSISAIDGMEGPGKYIVTGYYQLYEGGRDELIRAGAALGLRKKEKKYSGPVATDAYIEKTFYHGNMISETDEREMILIPSGRFLLGSNTGDRDEYPEQEIHIEDFYIDTYEVSNRDFKKFIDSSRSRPPGSWPGGRYDDEAGDLPVLVSYNEAGAYAKWAGKRLPTEFEWEKAARGTADLKYLDDKANKRTMYPWGLKFLAGKANTAELWGDRALVKILTEKLKLKGDGVVPVYSLQEGGASPYGVVNMSGNAAEWTSSWFIPYRNNRYENPRYGKQYKVVRGGSWISDKYKSRVSSREIGGIPSLDRDYSAGFRCVRDVTYLDRIIKK